MSKYKFSTKEKGLIINNQPDEDCGIQTGRYFNDFYGTWYEVERKDKSKYFMIGEPKGQSGQVK